MNGDAVKIPPPVATTVYANVPVDTAVLATNLYGPTTQLAAPAAARIPLIATAAGPQQSHHQALQVAAAPGQHQQLIAAHTAATHTQQPTLNSARLL
ncbi:La-related protein CG11505 [Eumeta japonica]|uniref:La-related protein CG11505 n=1 Tax=Eumeta variegata TaxID=151549 RepID=A0A4C2A6R6_EUMVA|nr:La-related protein CG11505 [Eumeta japonica]